MIHWSSLELTRLMWASLNLSIAFPRNTEIFLHFFPTTRNFPNNATNLSFMTFHLIFDSHMNQIAILVNFSSMPLKLNVLWSCISLPDVFPFWNIFSFLSRCGYAGEIQKIPFMKWIWEAQFINLLKPHSGQLTV